MMSDNKHTDIYLKKNGDLDIKEIHIIHLSLSIVPLVKAFIRFGHKNFYKNKNVCERMSQKWGQNGAMRGRWRHLEEEKKRGSQLLWLQTAMQFSI